MGARHVRTVARVRDRGGVVGAVRRRCAASGQPEFCHAGPSSEFRAVGHRPERGCAATRTCCRRGRTRRGRPLGCEYALYRHTGWRDLEDDERRNDLDAPHRQAGDTLDCESRLRSHRCHPQHLDRGDGPHRQRHRMFRRSLLLYRFRWPAERTVVLAGWRQHVDLIGRRDSGQSERGRSCCARQCIGGGAPS